MALRVGIKYYGALHLWCYITNALLQILCGSAAIVYPDVFRNYLAVTMTRDLYIH
jgi:hypothetical protein